MRRADSIARLLRRHFFNRFLDNDLVSPDTDRHEALALVLGGLVTTSLFLTMLLCIKYLFGYPTPAEAAINALDDRLFYVSASMVVMGLVTAMQWNALALDGRDTLILGPLPIPYTAIVRAKITALALFMSAFLIALNLVPAFVHPFLLVVNVPVGVASTLRIMAVHATVTGAAGALAFLTIVAVRELLRAALSARLFARASAAAQFVLVLLFVSAFLLLVSLPPAMSLLDDHRRSPYTAAYTPALWFLGLYETASAHAVVEAPRTRTPPRLRAFDARMTTRYRAEEAELAGLARTGLLALSLAAAVAVAGYAWNSRRLPSPVQVPRTRHSIAGRLLSAAARHVVVRRPLSRAGFFFALQTLFRSGPHRLGMAAAVAACLAVVTVTLRGIPLGVEMPAKDAPVTFLMLQTLVIAGLAIGLGWAIAIPADVRASALFEIARPSDCRQYRSGIKRALYLAVCLPAVLLLYPLHASLLGVTVAAAHSLIGALVALVAIQLVFLGFGRMPFATIRSNNGGVLRAAPAVAGVIVIAVVLAAMERAVLDSPIGFTVLATTLLAVAALFSRLERRRPDPLTLGLDEVADQPTLRLGLSQ